MALSETKVMALIQRIESSRNPDIDTIVLSTAVKLAYYI